MRGESRRKKIKIKIKIKSRIKSKIKSKTESGRRRVRVARIFTFGRRGGVGKEESKKARPGQLLRNSRKRNRHGLVQVARNRLRSDISATHWQAMEKNPPNNDRLIEPSPGCNNRCYRKSDPLLQ